MQKNTDLHSVQHANRVGTHTTEEFPLKGFEFSLVWSGFEFLLVMKTTRKEKSDKGGGRLQEREGGAVTNVL